MKGVNGVPQDFSSGTVQARRPPILDITIDRWTWHNHPTKGLAMHLTVLMVSWVSTERQADKGVMLPFGAVYPISLFVTADTGR
ncbi:MAG: hypothetical protein ACREQ5_01670 [Candidatus Dormibacteria bacterium]